MNKAEKETIGRQLKDEEQCLKDLEKAYKQARKDCQQKLKELNSRSDMQNLQSIIHQKKYQQALLKQIDGVLNDLQTHTYKTANDFFQGSYVNGYVGSMYELMNQGIPLTIPVNPKKMVRAIQTDSKLSTGYYLKQGLTVQNIRTLKKQVALEATRGIANGKSWLEVADSLSVQRYFQISQSDAMRIVRTEGNRINQQARLDAGDEAVDSGCDLMKQWDATLDGRTRLAHREADGQIVEWKDKFLVMGEHLEAPSIGGSASNVINCRCQLLKRPRWSLDEEELETLKKRAEFYGLDKSKSFEDYRNKFLNLPKEPVKPKTPKTPVKPKEPVKPNQPTLEDQIQEAEQAYKDLKTKRKEVVEERKDLQKSIRSYDRGVRRSFAKYDNYQTLEQVKARQNELLTIINNSSYTPQSVAMQRELTDLLNAEFSWDDIIRYRQVRKTGIEVLRKKVDDLDDVLKSLKGQMKGKIGEIRDLKIKSGDKKISKVLKKPVTSKDPRCQGMLDTLGQMGIDYNPILTYPVEETEEEIIEVLSGGDRTVGSCASVGLAYIGRKLGWDVLDFRGGKSQNFFSSSFNLNVLSRIDGIKTIKGKGKSSVTVGNSLLKQCEIGKEYYMCVGRHCAVVRKTADGKLQYLELQSAFNSGWQDFDGNPKSTLHDRFGCTQGSDGGASQQMDFMIDVSESNFDTDDFRSLLGFLNTEEGKQVKGAGGTIK